MSFLSSDTSGTMTDQLTRLLRDETTDNTPLVLELIEGGGSNRRILGYLFGIAVFHASRQVSERASALLKKYASADTLRQVERLKESVAYHYNESEYLGKYRNPEFDSFDFLLATKMCHWHRNTTSAYRSHYALIAHQTLDLTHFPEDTLSPALATLNFVRYITLPAHKGFQLVESLPTLLQIPLESVTIENIRFDTFPVELFQMTSLRILSIRRGTYRPRQPMMVPDTGTFGSPSLEKISIDGYPIEGESRLGPFPMLVEATIQRSTIKDISFLAQSPLLAHLHLKYNMIEELPAFLGDMVEIRTLDLGGNPLRRINIDLTKLRNLQDLEIKISKK